MHTPTTNPILRLAHAGMTALDRLEAELKADGFAEGPGPIDIASIRIDEEALAEGECDCGRRGLALVPYHHPKTRVYRAIALCPCCLDAFEF